MQDYIIDKVSWHTQHPGNTETSEEIYERFKVLIGFLQANGLTKKEILPEEKRVNEETMIHTQDLTEEGRLVMKACYHRWLTKLDRSKNRLKASHDLKFFEKELVKIRNRID